MTDLRSQQGRAVMQAIRDVLMQHGDPIGVSDSPEASDEEDGPDSFNRQILHEVARRLLRLDIRA